MDNKIYQNSTIKQFKLDHISGFKNARLISYFSNGGRPGRKLGAALYKKKSLISIGCNDFDKTHPIQLIKTNKKEFLHAEICAIVKSKYKYINNYLQNCHLYVYREDRFGNPTLAKPCNNCQLILKLFGIKKVYYSIPDEPYFAILKL